VKIYNCAAGKTVPEWMEDAKKKHKSLRYDQEFRNRLELIQDFTFPQTSQKIKISKVE
jgi:ribosome biogenesis protein ENP2